MCDVEACIRLKLRYAGAVLLLCLSVSAPASAGALQGTVKNGTTGKPAAGNQVLLLSLKNGMRVSGRGTTDASGRFNISVAGTQTDPWLVRVVHHGVPYDKMAPPGVNLGELQVYDVAQQLDGVAAVLGVQRFQTEGETLQVVEQIIVRNDSQPPHTLMTGRPFRMQLSPDAQVESGIVQAAGGQQLTSKPTPGEQKGQYDFAFSPLRPGETRFAVLYRLPYRGEAIIEPNVLYPLTQFAVVLPKSMMFEAKTPGVFQPMPRKTGTNVQLTAAVKPGQPLAFRVSGNGTLAELQGEPQETQGGDGPDPRPASSAPLPAPL